MTFGVGNRIRSRRMELGWTQDQLCSKVNLSKSFISEVENNKRNLSAANLLDIAKVLGLSTDFLMTGETGTQTQTLSLDIPQSLAEVRHLFQAREHVDSGGIHFSFTVAGKVLWWIKRN